MLAMRQAVVRPTVAVVPDDIDDQETLRVRDPSQRPDVPRSDRCLQPERCGRGRRARPPDFVYRIPGRSIVAGEFHGVAGFVEALARLRDESGGTIDVAPTAVLADDDNLIARARVTAERHGRRLSTENCYALRFVDGKVAEGQVFLSDPEHVENFWSDAAPVAR